MHTTGPKKVTAPSKKSGIGHVDKLLSFNAIEYPDLDTGFIGSPSPASSANTSLEPITNGKSYTPKGPLNPATTTNGSLYPSTSEVTKFAAIQSGAITVSKEPVKNYGQFQIELKIRFKQPWAIYKWRHENLTPPNLTYALKCRTISNPTLLLAWRHL